MTARFTIFLFIATFSATELLACQCANGLALNFLNKVDRFDAVVMGTYNSDNGEFGISLTIEKVYKGNIDQEEIKLLAGGTDCMHFMSFENGTQLILGLVNSPYSGEPDAYMAFGCSTSVITIDGDKATVAEHLHMRKQPKIGIFERSMNIKKLEKRINSKI
ncbi:MAG: hypothetical protein ABJG41_09015 [Cyclobacteriaceae bacterium]